MIFFLVMPGLYGGFGNYFGPIFLGAPEVGFPRVNSFSFLLLPVSYGFLLVSSTSEFPGGAGWTLYPPLSTSLMSLAPVAVDLIIDALLVAGVSSFFSSHFIFLFPQQCKAALRELSKQTQRESHSYGPNCSRVLSYDGKSCCSWFHFLS